MGLVLSSADRQRIADLVHEAVVAATGGDSGQTLCWLYAHLGAALVYRVSAIPARVRFGLINVEVGDKTAIYTDPELWPESSSSDPDRWPGSSYHCWFTHRGSIVDLAFQHLPSWVRPPSRWMRPAASYIWDRPAYLRAQGIDFIPRPGQPGAFGLPTAHQEVVDRGVELLDQASAWVR